MSETTEQQAGSEQVVSETVGGPAASDLADRPVIEDVQERAPLQQPRPAQSDSAKSDPAQTEPDRKDDPAQPEQAQAETAGSARATQESPPAQSSAAASDPDEPATRAPEVMQPLDVHEPHVGELIADLRHRRRRVRTLDFSQPTKFTAELRRRIGRVLVPFCETVTARLTAELRAPVEMIPLDTEQLTWAAARAQLPADALALGLDVLPIERQLLLCIERPLVLRMLECLLGGEAANAAPSRRLSEIDWALTRQLLEPVVGQLSLAWRDLGGLELRLREIDVEGDAGVFAPIGEPTFAVRLECQIDGLGATMSLLIPWSTIEPVSDDILGTSSQGGGDDPHEQDAVRRGLASARVLLRAEIGSRQMPFEQVLALEPGMLVRLDESSQEGVCLYAEDVPLGRGRPGRHGARRAIKLTSPARPSGVRPPSSGSRAGQLASPAPGAGATLDDIPILRHIPVRVWAELGRTSVPLGRALELPEGSVVELDQDAEAPVGLFVNGLRFAEGELMVTAEDEWAVRVTAKT